MGRGRFNDILKLTLNSISDIALEINNDRYLEAQIKLELTEKNIELLERLQRAVFPKYEEIE